MIFNFLREFLKDDEFEKTKIELVETKALLKEYKDFLQEQMGFAKEEREKVDPDFLVLLWASIGFAFLMFGESAKNVNALQGTKPIPFYIWLIFTLVSLAFVIINSVSALELTQEYAKAKSNSSYANYAYSVIIGVLILVVGVLWLAFMN